LSEDISHAEGLSHDAFEFFEDRALLIGAVVDLPALHLTDDDAGIGQVFQLPLHCPAADFHGVQDLFGVKRAIRPPVEKGQHCLPCFAEDTTTQIFIHSTTLPSACSGQA